MKKVCIFAVSVFLAACANTGTNGVVTIAPNLYMVGGLGEFTDFSSASVKARFYQQASQFCSAMGKNMQPVSSTGRDSGLATYATAEVQFRCS
jgi:hypothetical protein